jgi:N-acetylneuraminic acid mutarotase
MLIFSANPLPQPIYWATVVPFGNSFLLVGGMTTDDTRLSTIYHYDPHEDCWTLLDAKLKEGKTNVIALMVDRKLFSI